MTILSCSKLSYTVSHTNNFSLKETYIATIMTIQSCCKESYCFSIAIMRWLGGGKDAWSGHSLESIVFTTTSIVPVIDGVAVASVLFVG